MQLNATSSDPLKNTQHSTYSGGLHVSSFGLNRDFTSFLQRASSAKPTPSQPVPSAPIADSNSFEQRVVELTNQFRTSNGLNPLSVNPALTGAAEEHSRAMAIDDFFSHTNPNGATMGQQIQNAGYKYSYAGQNIAAGQATPEAVVQGWINSPGHRANMLNPNFTEIGVGFFNNPTDQGNVNYRNYWTQDFGKPQALA